MFSATKLLGGLMEQGLGGSGMLGTAAKVAGVAAVGGVAYGAYRHYQAGGFGQGGPGLFGGSHGAGATPPPQPSPFAGAEQGSPFAGGAATPSGNPWGGAAAGGNPWAAAATSSDSVPAPASPTTPSPRASSEPTDGKAREEAQALLLVRAMIAAAHVDGRLDARERENIVSGAATAGLAGAEREALEHELAHPQRPNLLLGAVDDVELARQVYFVTLLAVDRDNATEQAYVAGLPIYLGLTPADVVAIHQQLGFVA